MTQISEVEAEVEHNGWKCGFHGDKSGLRNPDAVGKKCECLCPKCVTPKSQELTHYCQGGNTWYEDCGNCYYAFSQEGEQVDE